MKKLLAVLAATALTFAPITVMGTEGSSDVTGNTSSEETNGVSEDTPKIDLGTGTGSVSSDVTGNDSEKTRSDTENTGTETEKDPGDSSDSGHTGDVSGNDNPAPTPAPGFPEDELGSGYYSNNCWIVIQPGTVPEDEQQVLRKVISQNKDFIEYADQEFKFFNIEPAGHTPGKEVKIQVSFGNLDSSKPVYVVHYNPSDPENEKNWITPTVSGTTITFTYSEFSPFVFVYSKMPEQTSTTVTSPTSSVSTSASTSHYNPVLDKGATWVAEDGSFMTSLGDGRYYNQFNTVFDGAGNIVGKYNANTGAVSMNKKSADIAGGSYVVPNTADKN